MNKTIVIIVAALTLLVGGGATAYLLTRDAGAPQANTSPSPSRADDTEGTEHKDAMLMSDSPTITYTDDGFNPQSLSVKAGVVIKVINNSSAILEFSSGIHPTHQENPELNMTALQPGEEGTIKVTAVGDHTFHNHLNSGHSGSLTVTE